MTSPTSSMLSPVRCDDLTNIIDVVTGDYIHDPGMVPAVTGEAPLLARERSRGIGVLIRGDGKERSGAAFGGPASAGWP
jgi:hypothetical protein